MSLPRRSQSQTSIHPQQPLRSSSTSEALRLYQQANSDNDSRSTSSQSQCGSIVKSSASGTASTTKCRPQQQHHQQQSKQGNGISYIVASEDTQAASAARQHQIAMALAVANSEQAFTTLQHARHPHQQQQHQMVTKFEATR